ncbi:hypothetical protein GW17_00023640 [Ensete ventricosum]|nr:hypothetical protein GW17_00023640 [Ensete ventricosum]
MLVSIKTSCCSFRYYKIIEADHFSFIVNRERAGVQFDLLYDGIFQRCRNHIFRSSTPILPNDTAISDPHYSQITEAGDQGTDKRSDQMPSPQIPVSHRTEDIQISFDDTLPYRFRCYLVRQCARNMLSYMFNYSWPNLVGTVYMDFYTSLLLA